MLRFELPFRLPSCNEYINACRTNAYAGAAMKKRCENMIAMLLKGKIEGDVKFVAEWHEPNKRRDIDNIIFAKKFIFDALQKKGVIDNDKQIKEINEKVIYDGKEKIIFEIVNV